MSVNVCREPVEKGRAGIDTGQFSLGKLFSETDQKSARAAAHVRDRGRGWKLAHPLTDGNHPAIVQVDDVRQFLTVGLKGRRDTHLGRVEIKLDGQDMVTRRFMGKEPGGRRKTAFASLPSFEAVKGCLGLLQFTVPIPVHGGSCKLDRRGGSHGLVGVGWRRSRSARHGCRSGDSALRGDHVGASVVEERFAARCEEFGRRVGKVGDQPIECRFGRESGISAEPMPPQGARSACEATSESLGERSFVIRAGHGQYCSGGSRCCERNGSEAQRYRSEVNLGATDE